MTEKTEILTRISPAYKALYDLQTDVRAAKLWYNILTGNSDNKPIDSANSAEEIGEAYLARFYKIYEELRTGRSQFDKRVKIYGIEKKFDTKYLNDGEKNDIKEAFQTFAESLFDHTGNSKNNVDIADSLYALYRTLQHSALYDTQSSFGLLLAEMRLVSPKFTANFAPDGIDFSRAEKGMEMRIRIEQALDKSRDIPLKEIEPFIPLPGQDMVTYIAVDYFEFRLGKLVDAMFAKGVTTEQRKLASQAINTALGYKAIEDQSIDKKEEWKTKLTEGIDGKYPNHPDRLARFLELVQSQNVDLSKDNPLKTYKSLEIGGCRFPIHRIHNDQFPHGQWHLVLKNGQLVNATDEVRQHIEAHLKAGKPIGDIDLSDKIACHADGKPFNAIDFLKTSSFEALSPEVRKQVWEGLNACTQRDGGDGVKPSALLCLDQDEVTGLRMDGSENPYKKFQDFLAEKKDSFITLMNQFCRMEGTPEQRFAKLWESLTTRDNADKVDLQSLEKPLKRAFINAYNHAHAQLPEDATPQKNPHFFTLVGATASGKSVAEKMLHAFIPEGSPCMRATLDDSRPLADPSYWLEIATNNHHDDYKNFSGFGEMVRAATIEIALQNKQHLILDSSGIPWRGKNEDLAKKFKENDYTVCTFATASPLLVAIEELQEIYATILHNFGKRGEEQQRFVPLLILLEKAIAEAIAVQNAMASERIDHFVMVDSTIGGKNQPIIAYSQDIDRQLIPALRNAREEGSEAFQNILKQNNLFPKWMEDRWPENKHCNFQIALDHGGGKHRMIAITDNEHLMRSQEKGLLSHLDPQDPSLYARGVDDLLSYRHMSFDVSGRRQGKNDTIQLTTGDLGAFRKLDAPPKQEGLLQEKLCHLAGIIEMVRTAASATR